jgi:hypothetical protein
MRTSGLLQPFVKNPSDVRRCVDLSYKIRSKYLHGVKTKFTTSELKTAADEILEYCRKILLISLLMVPSVGQDEFLELIDDAIVDPNRMADLVEQVKKFDIGVFIGSHT